MLTVKETNQKLVKDTIDKLIKSGTYKDISEIRKRNPSLQEFCFNNKLSFIMYSFSSQFTNEDYLTLLNQLEKEMQMNKDNENKIVETNINGNVFVDYNNSNENKTLVGVEEVNKQDTDSATYEQEQKFEKREANFQNISDIDTSKLNNEQLQDLSVIATNAEATDNKENTEVYFDENGSMTNTVAINQDGERSYYTVDEINGSKDLVGHEASKANSAPQKSNVKVKTLSNGHKSAAFTNTLILSFIIGSFFGIVFLAIYTKIMH